MNRSVTNRYLLAGTAGVAVAPIIGIAAGPTAAAADLPLKAPPPPVSAPIWAGWYLGLNAGGVWESNYFNCVGCTDFPTAVAGTHKGSAFIGGAQIGYNWQQGNFVYGIEGDISGLTKSTGTYVNNPNNNGTTYGSHVSWMSTIRGRLGVTVGDGSTLLYGTGGVAIAGITAKSEGGFFGWPINSYSHTKVGWAAGGGVEHMFTPHWTVGLEGLFADFGSSTRGSDVDGKCCATIRDRVFIGRAKLNYKF